MCTDHIYGAVQGIMELLNYLYFHSDMGKSYEAQHKLEHTQQHQEQQVCNTSTEMPNPQGSSLATQKYKADPQSPTKGKKVAKTTGNTSHQLASHPHSGTVTPC